MKRRSKICTWILVLSMLFAACSCTKTESTKRDRDDDSDVTSSETEEQKQSETDVEKTIETSETEETTEAQESETSSEEAYPLGSGTLTMKETLDAAYTCLGMEPEQANAFLTASFGITGFNVTDPTGDDSYWYEIADFDKEPTIEGFGIKRITLHISKGNKVYKIEFHSSRHGMTTVEFADEKPPELGYPAIEASEAFRSALTVIYGEPATFENPQVLDWYDGANTITVRWNIDANTIEGQNFITIQIKNSDLQKV